MPTRTWMLNGIAFATTVLLLLAADRALLAVLGRPLWVADPVLHYKHRPGAEGRWAPDKPIRINSHGHHDDEFPTEKPAGALRILNLGDSITMGHGVTRDETYSNQLERLLVADASLPYRRVQAINAGVQGYATFQELEVLRRSLVFSPDYVTVGFCLNDVTEPFAVNRRFGGTGLDYHRVVQTTGRLAGYLLNETGFGRFVQEVRLRFGDVRAARLEEAIDVRSMIATRDAADVQRRWGLVLRDLEALYALARANNTPVALLIFPFTFQLGHPETQWPQQVLKEHARQHDVAYIDFTDVFERLLAADEATPADYFLDEDHLTVRGHAVVAQTLMSHLYDQLQP